LLENAVYQSAHLILTHRIREQARSHIEFSLVLETCQLSKPVLTATIRNTPNNAR